MSSIIKADVPAIRATTQNALQEAAGLFKQNKVEEASQILCDRIFVPGQEGVLTQGQIDVVYRSITPDPLAPETPFSQRQYIPAAALKGGALRDLVKFYSAALHPDTLKEGPEKTAILKAAEILETTGDESAAWVILHKDLPDSLDSNKVPRVTEKVIKEVYQIMFDSLRTPTSSFLQKRVKDANPDILDSNRLRAKALESLSLHLFDGGVVQGTPVMPTLPPLVISREILSYASSEELETVNEASKSSIETVKRSIKTRTEATVKDLRAWQKMGITFDKETLPALRSIKGELTCAEDSEALNAAIRVCSNLTEIDLDASGSSFLLTNTTFQLIGQNCPGLVRFAFRNYRDKIIIEPLVQGCHKLQHLDLEGTVVSARDRSKISSIPANCPDLISINILGPDEDDMRDFVEKCKNLTHVTIQNIGYLDDQILNQLAKCLKLQSLSFNRKSMYKTSFTRAGIRTLAQNCKSLRHIEFTNCDLEEGSLSEIGNAKLPLRSIVMEDIWGLSPNDFVALAQGSPDLQVAQFRRCQLTNELLAALSDCHSITSLDISLNQHISAEGVQTIAQGLPRLTKLSLSPDRTQGVLQALANGNCNLSELDMSCLDEATAEEIIAFAKKNPGLTHLNLNRSENLSDEVLIAISHLLPNLESIDLSRTSVTPKGIALLGKNCPKIKDLKVSWLKKYNQKDALLFAIAENFSSLTDLNIEGNRLDAGKAISNFSRKGFEALGKGCPNIIRLSVDCNCLGISELRAIATSFFKLQFFNHFNNLERAGEFREELLKNSPNAKIYPAS